MANEQEIREAAYYIWLNNGCPEGVEIDCWLEAEAEVPCEGEACCCDCAEEEPVKAKKAPAKKACATKKTATKATTAKTTATKKTTTKKAVAKK